MNYSNNEEKLIVVGFEREEAYETTSDKKQPDQQSGVNKEPEHEESDNK